MRRTALLSVALALAAAAPDAAASAKRPAVRAAIPAVATAGDVVRVSGRAHGVRRVALQQRVAGRWLSRVRGRGGRFSLGWRAPDRRAVVTLRVAAVRGSRVVAVSRPRRVAVSPVEVLAPGRVVDAPAPGVEGELRYGGRAPVAVGEYVALDAGPQTPEGLLVRVVSRRRAGGDTLLGTVPAGLTEAIPEGHLVTSRTGAARLRRAAPESFLAALSCSGGVAATLDGSLRLALSPQFELGWSRGRVRTAEAAATLTGDAELTARIDGRGACGLGRTAVGAWNAPPLRLSAGPIPVVIVPRTTLYVEGELEAHAAVETGIAGHMSATAGLRLDRGGEVGPLGAFDHRFSHTPPSTRADAAVAARVTPSVTFLIYGQAGPRFDLGTGLALTAEAGASPWWTLEAPVQLSAGLQVPGLPSLSIEPRSVLSKSFPIAQAAPDAGAEPGIAPRERARASWSSNRTDVDLHVWDVHGNHASFGDKAGIPGALLSSDDTDGFGPESFDDETGSGRSLSYGLCYFDDHGLGATDVSVRLTDPDGRTRVLTHTLGRTGDSVLLGSSPAGPGYTPPDGWCAP